MRHILSRNYVLFNEKDELKSSAMVNTKNERDNCYNQVLTREKLSNQLLTIFFNDLLTSFPLLL